MSAVVIGIQRDTQGGLWAQLLHGPTAWPEALSLAPVHLPSLPNCDTSANVTAYGQAVYNALCAQPAIARELTRLTATPPIQADALQFRISAPEAEAYRWETLCSAAGGFLAVNPGRRVSRLTAPRVLPGGVDARRFVPPLRFTAFLSAIGVEARKELETICDQLSAATANGLPFDARIFVGESNLLGAAASPGVALLPMPPSADLLKAELKARPPQFLHFFCHGAVNFGSSALEMATLADWMQFAGGDGTRSSIKLTVEELALTLEGLEATWLTVLNSCKAAQSVARLNSMAYRLAERGSAFAVGWNEPVGDDDASHLSGVFYREVFGITAAALGQSANEGVEVDLSPAILPVRQNFLNMYSATPPEAFGRWSVPVLYESSDRLRVQGVDNEPQRARINFVAGALREMPEGTPPDVREQVLALLKIPPEVPPELWPDLQGRMPESAGGAG